MSFFKSAKKALRKVYNFTSKSKWSKYDPIFAGAYHARQGFRSMQQRMAPTATSAGSYSDSIHGPTGSIVGRY